MTLRCTNGIELQAVLRVDLEGAGEVVRPGVGPDCVTAQTSLDDPNRMRMTKTDPKTGTSAMPARFR